MYTILVLVSLAAAVSCHHAIPDPFGDDSVGQARIKRLGELDDSISRLVARAMNLKSALTQRLKNKEEADRKAKNILLRLDRMNVDDGVQRCADTDKDFRCRRSSKCIKNILVCDGKKDCDDGTDEDKDLCRKPFKVGNEIVKISSSINKCHTHQGEEKITNYVQQITEYDFLPNFNKVNCDVHIKTKSMDLADDVFYEFVSRFNYAKRSLVSFTIYYGIRINLNMYFEIGEDTITTEVRTVDSNYLCFRGRYFMR